MANDNYKVHPSLYLEAMNEYDKNYGYSQIEKNWRECNRKD